MNLLRSSTLLIFGLIILVGERIYFVHKNDVAIKTGENVDIAAQNSTYNDYNQYLQTSRTNKGNTIATNAYTAEPDNEKNVLHTANSRLRPSGNGRGLGNDDNQWSRYSDELPKVFLLSNAARAGVDYSNKNPAYLKQLASQGDILGKFLYAYQLNKAVDTELSKGVAGDAGGRIAEIRQLYIESAVGGLHAGAHELSRLYYSPRFRDLVEALTWALIADAMRDGGEKSVSRICSERSAPCTGAALAQATAKARNYLSHYAFKVEGGNP